MSTTTVQQPPAKPVVKLPTVSPYAAYPVICPNPKCLAVLQPKAGIDKKTGETIIYYHCENCHYDFSAQLTHVNGIAKPEGKLELK